MFHLIRTIALKAFMLGRRFYLASPASPYEAILFGYIKATLAQLFFREVPRATV
jgi:hypothetical protein